MSWLRIVWQIFMVLGCTCSIMLLSSHEILAQSTKNQLNSVQKQIRENNSKLAPKKRQKRRAEFVVNKLSKEIKYTELKLKKTKSNLRVALRKEKKVKHELVGLEAQFNTLKLVFQQRISELYKLSPLGLFELMFSGNDFVLDTESAYFFSKLLEQDVALVSQLKQDFSVLQDKRESLRRETIMIQSLKKDIESREKSLVRKKLQQKRHIKSLESEISELLKQNQELETLSRELTALIRQQEVDASYYATGAFIKPVKGWISSRFGMRMHPIFKRRIKHTGIDIAAPKGYKIRAANSGKVIFAGTKGGYGKSVLIYHGKRPKDGKSLSSFYAHQSRILVKRGDYVEKGDEIGWVGSTGYATGPHLHFEMKLAGKHVDPLKFIR